MERVLALVEGQTEEQFIKLVIAPHLWAWNVQLDCTIVVTAKEEGRRAHRGGVTSYIRIRDDVRLLLRSNSKAVTTLFDVYAFPRDLPGYPQPWPPTTSSRVAGLAKAVEADIGDTRFFAGFLAHEFEGLLFADPAALASVLEPDEKRRPALTERLANERAGTASPEDIDDGPATAPSKRLLRHATYDKPRHGPQAILAIGLPVIRAQCPNFSSWLARLEALGTPPAVV